MMTGKWCLSHDSLGIVQKGTTQTGSDYFSFDNNWLLEHTWTSYTNFEIFLVDETRCKSYLNADYLF